MYYEEVFQALNKNNVQYIVVGGVALVLHGVVRMTADLDLMIQMGNENVSRFLSTIKKLGYKPKLPVPIEDFTHPEKREQWREEKGMEVFSLFHPEHSLKTIDVFVYEPIDYDEVDAEKEIASAKDITIPYVSIRHLKALKKMSGRKQDQADIEALEALEQLQDE